MKNTIFLFAFLMVCGLFAFKSDKQVALVNRSNTPMNEAILKRLLLKNIKGEVKEDHVTLTILTFSKSSEESPLRTDDSDSRLMTKRITYQSNLILTIGEETQQISKNDVWVGRLGGLGLNPPTNEELIVDMVTKHLSQHNR